MNLYNCKNCGIQFENKKLALFCSNECRNVRICPFCRTKFVRKYRFNQYCSIKCRNNSRIGKKLSEEHKRKISESGLNLHRKLSEYSKQKIAKSNPKPHSIERCKNISKAKLICYTKEDFNNVFNFIKKRVLPLYLIRKELNLRVSPFNRIIKDLLLNKLIESDDLIFKNKRLFQWDVNSLKWLKDNFKNFTAQEIKDQLNLKCGIKNILSICF